MKINFPVRVPAAPLFAALLFPVLLTLWSCAGTFAPYLPAPETERAGLYREISGTFDEALERDLVLGLSAAMIDGTGESYSWHMGHSDPARTRPIPPGAVYRIASISKIHTAVLFACMEKEGLLDYDDTLDTWFPEIRHADRIRLSQLLNHTSGIGKITLRFPVYSRIYFHPDTVWQREEILKIIGEMRPVGVSGKKHFYSNTNYILLGYIMEEAGASPLSELYRRYIWSPLSLGRTFLLPDDEFPGGLIAGYSRGNIPFYRLYEVRPEQRGISSLVRGAGSIASTAEDTARFLHALFHGRVIGGEQLGKMTENMVPRRDQFHDYGYGLMRTTFNGQGGPGEGRTGYGHIGEFIGFSTIVFYFPDLDITFCILTNTTPLDIEAMMSKILSVLEKYY